MPGFDNDVIYAGNVDFRGVKPRTATVVADGQLLIGSTAAPNIRVGTITAGAGITVTNSSGGITIGAVSPVNFSWQTVDSTSNVNPILVFNGYITAGVALTELLLPPTANIGDMFMVTGYSSLFQIQQAAGQVIYFGASTSTIGVTGTITSTAVKDHLTLICVVANTEFKVIDAVGNFTLA